MDTMTLAQTIFINWATQSGYTNWQWDEIAKSACNAANRFAEIARTELVPSAPSAAEMMATMVATPSIVTAPPPPPPPPPLISPSFTSS